MPNLAPLLVELPTGAPHAPVVLDASSYTATLDGRQYRLVPVHPEPETLDRVIERIETRTDRVESRTVEVRTERIETRHETVREVVFLKDDNPPLIPSSIKNTSRAIPQSRPDPKLVPVSTPRTGSANPVSYDRTATRPNLRDRSQSSVYALTDRLSDLWRRERDELDRIAAKPDKKPAVQTEREERVRRDYQRLRVQLQRSW